MAFRARSVGLLLSSLLIAGCGTVVNLAKPGPAAGGKIPFGGVRQDVYCIKQAANGEPVFGTHSEAVAEQHPQVAPMLVYAADLPFSFIGDVVTWPYTAAYSCINQPVPTPPVTQAPIPVVTQPMAVGQTPTPTVETLPEPRKVP